MVIKPPLAQADVAPALQLAHTTIYPYEYVTVTASGFAPNEAVIVFVNTLNGVPFTSLSCNTSGICKGQLSFYGISMLAGSYTVFAEGRTSSLQAQTTFTLVAGVTVSPNTGLEVQAHRW